MWKRHRRPNTTNNLYFYFVFIFFGDGSFVASISLNLSLTHFWSSGRSPEDKAMTAFKDLLSSAKNNHFNLIGLTTYTCSAWVKTSKQYLYQMKNDTSLSYSYQYLLWYTYITLIRLYWIQDTYLHTKYVPISYHILLRVYYYLHGAAHFYNFWSQRSWPAIHRVQTTALWLVSGNTM